jgi:hypothetical protein
VSRRAADSKAVMKYGSLHSLDRLTTRTLHLPSRSSLLYNSMGQLFRGKSYSVLAQELRSR